MRLEGHSWGMGWAYIENVRDRCEELGTELGRYRDTGLGQALWGTQEDGLGRWGVIDTGDTGMAWLGMGTHQDSPRVCSGRD